MDEKSKFKSNQMNLKCKPAVELNLLTGERIWTNRINIRYTYGSWITGIPTTNTNKEDLLDLPGHAVKSFGDFPVHVVPPEFKYPDLKYPIHETLQLMPPFEIMAMFDSDPISDACWSSLIICWHQYSVPPLVEEWILPSLQSISWKDLAKDWFY